MDRLIAPNSVIQSAADTAPTTGTPQFATDGNPASGIPATIWPAYAWNAIQEEIMAVLSAAGLVPDRTNNAQLLAALQGNSGKNIAVFTASGTWIAPACVTLVRATVVGGSG